MLEYDVWHPNFAIPEPLIKRLRLKNDYLEDYKYARLRGYVASEKYGDADICITDGYCVWHDDKHLPFRYSCALIIVNNSNSWIESKSVSAIVNQPVGSLVSFNTHKLHRLNQKNGRRGKKALYACLICNSNELKSREEWENQFLETL